MFPGHASFSDVNQGRYFALSGNALKFHGGRVYFSWTGFGFTEVHMGGRLQCCGYHGHLSAKRFLE